MVVGVMTVNLHLHGLTSLKQKRGIVKSLIGRLRSKYNISISEVGRQDNKQLAMLGISIVSNDTSFIHEKFDKILEFMRRDGRFYLGKIEREIF
ncbi:MAG: DUF503 domain-containing protein [Planctomycetota bacterium]|jgi:uncharacterized protein YlxP (DUF503 family)